MYYWAKDDSRCRGGRGEHRPYGSRLVQLHARSLYHLGGPEPPRLGGLDPVTMEPIVVEVDETKYFQRKYARGQWHEGH